MNDVKANLRDWIALKAMELIWEDEELTELSEIATKSYEMADAMLRARGTHVADYRPFPDSTGTAVPNIDGLIKGIGSSNRHDEI